MSRLATVRLTFHGDFRDVWLYKEFLYCWDRTGVLHFAPLGRILRHILRTSGPAVATLVEHLVLRTDWKMNGQFRTMMRAPEVQRAFFSPLAEKSDLEIHLPDGLLSRSISEQFSGGVLDTNIYADHVYLATTEGLLQTFVNPTLPEQSYPLQKVLDQRVSRVNVRFSAVNASAGNQGLHFAPLGIPPGNQHKFVPHNFHPIADKSRSSIHLGKSLLNYAGGPAPDLLRAQVRESETSVTGRERASVLGYDNPVDLDALTFAAVSTSKTVVRKGAKEASTAGGFEVLGNTDKRLLVAWNDRLRVVDMRLTPSTPSDDIKAAPSARYRKTQLSDIKPIDILQTLPVPGGFIVEQYEAVSLINSRGSFTLVDDAVAIVRTFSGSLRHKEVVAVVGEDSISLIGYYIADETLF